MTKRKIEAEVELTTNVDALDEVDKRLDEIESKDVEIGVEADTRDAQTALERFDSQVEGLTKDGRELRIEFKAQTLQREIRNALRDLEKLDDPNEIELRTDDLERAQKELRELAELADKKYDVEIDADPKRNAQRAAGDMDTLRQRGEGLQSAIPAIRGFGDELGGTSAAAGIASQAIADLGDFALITGERFAESGSKMSGVATKIGTALGAAGLAGAVAGIAVQMGQVALPAIRNFITGQSDASEEADKLTTALLEQTDALEGVDDVLDGIADADPFVAAILADGDEDKLKEITDALGDLGVGISELPATAQRARDDFGGLVAELLAARGVPSDLADEFAHVVYELGQNPDSDLAERISQWMPTITDTTEALAKLDDETDFEQAATRTAVLTDRVDELDAMIAEGKDWPEIYQALSSGIDESADSADAARDSVDEYAAAQDEAVAAAEAMADAAHDEADAITAAADARRAAADSWYGVIKAQNDVADATAKVATTLEESGDGSAEYQEALIDATLQTAALGDAQVQLATDVAAQNGEQLAASESTSVWNRAMLDAASTASGPLQQSIVDYIAQVNGIPPEKVSDILANLDEEGVESASKELDDASATRESQIRAEAITSDADRELDAVANEYRVATIYGDVTIRRNVRWDQDSGSFVPTYGRAASSAPNLASPLAAPASTRARAAASSAQSYLTAGTTATVPITLEAQRSPSTSVTVNLPRAAEARDVVRVLDRWVRVNGRA